MVYRSLANALHIPCLALCLFTLMSGHEQASCFSVGPIIMKESPIQSAKVLTESPSIEDRIQSLGGDGLHLRLGQHAAEPFLRGTFPPQYLYALQKLQSDEQMSFGAAFISLRSSDKKSSTCRWQLGQINSSKILALHRFKLWWMKPTHCGKTSDIPPETQLILSEMPPDPDTGVVLYSLFVPLYDGPAKCSLKGLPDQHIQLLAETGCANTPVPSEDFVGLFVAVHDDPFELLNKGFKLIQKRLVTQVKFGSLGGLMRGAEHALYSLKRHEVVKRGSDSSAPDMCNYLGWCTWDSFYTSVDSSKVFEGLHSLAAAGVRPKWIVLDDGWQSTSNVKAQNGEQWMDHLTSLVANKKFRDERKGLDLRDTVEKAKADFGIKYFLVWHAIAGYWAGVDLDAPDLSKFKPQRARLTAPLDIVAVDPDMKMFFRVCMFLNKRFGVVPPENILSFYNEYHRYLRDQGVDGVKVDAQSLINFVGYNNGGSVEMARAYHYALSRSVKRHFPDTNGEGRVIHCMCHDNEILLTLPSCYNKRVLIRGSDDFYPRDEASHGSHLYNNAFNSLLVANCGLQDWDMFQTTLGAVSWMHAASRAISGGPVYISDRPGQHDTDLLKRIVLKDGSVLRPVHNALPTLSCLFRNSQVSGGGPLTLWNENPAPGHAVLGAFNIQGSQWDQQRRSYVFTDTTEGHVIPASFSPKDCNVLLVQEREKAEVALKADGELSHAHTHESEGDMYAVYLHLRGTLGLLRLQDRIHFGLRSNQFELAAVSRVHMIGQGCLNKVEWASIGLVAMFNSGGAIISETIENQSSRVTLKLIGSGQFLAYCSLRPSSVSLDGVKVVFSYGISAANPKTGGTDEGYIGGEIQEEFMVLDINIPSLYSGNPRTLEVVWEGIDQNKNLFNK